MVIAPFLVATLNRYEHLKNCLESLSKCTLADQTDVFIALDYPSKEEHFEGYNKIVAYLEHTDELGFKSMNVKKRTYNYFLGNKNGNLGALWDEVFETYDRAIISEDDNVFSPNFLVFMNKGLEKFENDDTVFAINGYRHFYPVKFADNTFFRQNVDFSAWGFGVWRNKFKKYFDIIGPEYFRSKMSLKNFLKVYKNGNSHTSQFFHQANEAKPYRSDFVIGVMMALEGLDVVMPSVSLVRNMGWDGTGINCAPSRQEDAQRHTTQKISSELDFEYVGTGREFYDENRKIYIKSSYEKNSTWHLIIVIINYFIKTVLRKLHLRK